MKRHLLTVLTVVALAASARGAITSVITYPQGPAGSVQFKNGGVFGGSSDIAYSSSTRILTIHEANINALTVGSLSLTSLSVGSLTTTGVSTMRTPVTINQPGTGVVTSALQFSQPGATTGSISQYGYSSVGPSTYFNTPMVLTQGTGQVWIDSNGGVAVGSDGLQTQTTFYVAGNLLVGTGQRGSGASPAPTNGIYSLGDIQTAGKITVGAATTTINGQTYYWPSAHGSGQCLSDDGTGHLSWAACSGGGGSASTGRWVFAGSSATVTNSGVDANPMLSMTNTDTSNNPSVVVITSTGTGNLLRLVSNGEPGGGVQQHNGGALNIQQNTLGDAVVIVSSFPSAQIGTSVMLMYVDNANYNDPIWRVFKTAFNSAPEARWDSPAPNMEIINTSTDNAHGLGKWEPFAIGHFAVDLQVNSRAWDNSTFENVARWHPLDGAGDGRPPGLYLAAQDLTNDSGVLSSSNTATVRFATRNGHEVGIAGPLDVAAGSWDHRLPPESSISGQVIYGGATDSFGARPWHFTTGGSAGQCLQNNGTSAPTWGSCGGGGAAALAIAQAGVSGTWTTIVSSPTAAISFSTAAFTVTLQGASTAFVSLNGNVGVSTITYPSLATYPTVLAYAGSSRLITNPFVASACFGEDACPASATHNMAAFGYHALRSDLQGPTAFGYLALSQTGSTAVNPTAVGYGAGSTLTGGVDATFIGEGAGSNMINGDYNTAVGAQTLSGNGTSPSGDFNTAVGAASQILHSTGTNNTSVGAYSLYSTSTGTYNTGIGEGAGTYGDRDYRTLLGAGTAAEQSSHAIVIGFGAATNDYPSNPLTNVAVIGDQSVVSISNAMVLGDGRFSFTTYNVGIATDTPRDRLHVQGGNFRLDNGHMVVKNGTPSLSTCGTSPSVTGTDTAGIITFGGGSPTACTLTFATSFGTAPSCVISDDSTTIGSDITSKSATSFTVTTSAAFGGGHVNYHCIGL